MGVIHYLLSHLCHQECSQNAQPGAVQTELSQVMEDKSTGGFSAVLALVLFYVKNDKHVCHIVSYFFRGHNNKQVVYDVISSEVLMIRLISVITSDLAFFFFPS